MIAIFSALPVALVFPFVGLLLWAWTSFSSINREALGISYDFPFNFYIAVTTIFAWVISTEPKTLPAQAMPILVIAFAAWTSISTYFALDYDSSYLLWDNHIKTMILLLVTMALVTSKLRVQAFLWIIALSIGYYAAKGAGFFLMTGSINSKVFGPDHSMISDNNNLSLAMVITMPLLIYLRATSANYWVKIVCAMLVIFSIIATIGTYSRGGFVGLMIVAGAYLVMSRKKLVPLIASVVVATAVWNYAPADWFDRVDTIEKYDKDSSSVGRLNAWQTSWNLAEDRPLVGGGFSAIENKRIYHRYRGPKDKTDSRAAHSIYFQVLGDHGFVGFFLYIAILTAGIYNLYLVQRWTAGRQELEWAGLLSRMMLVSVAGFVAAGGFLSMAYYDVFLSMMALTVALREVVRKTAFVENENPSADRSPIGLVPAWRTVAMKHRK